MGRRGARGGKNYFVANPTACSSGNGIKGTLPPKAFQDELELLAQASHGGGHLKAQGFCAWPEGEILFTGPNGGRGLWRSVRRLRAH